ncbi:hypothetical protein BDF19DRAFT_210942 [Syncephalis fuscata]|nr:hypothetical protein BDF19DRAFT_210942 [Syncephalis fuscata]
MQREQGRGRPLRILLISSRISHRMMSNMTAMRGVAIEETIMAAAQIDPRLMKQPKQQQEDDDDKNEQQDQENEDGDDTDQLATTLSMKHPARGMTPLRRLILGALSPSIRLSSSAWCALLEWTAFRVPPMATRLLDKARRDGFVMPGSLGEKLLTGSTLRPPYSLSVIYKLYTETIEAGGQPNRRSVSRLLHLLLQQAVAEPESSQWTLDKRVLVAWNIFEAEVATNRLPHAAANRLLIERLASHGHHLKAESVYNTCRQDGHTDGRQVLIYSAMIHSHIVRKQLTSARQVLDEMLIDTLRRQEQQQTTSSTSNTVITGPKGELVAIRLRDEDDVELYNTRMEEEEEDEERDRHKTVICTLWPHAQTAGTLIDAYGRRGHKHYFSMAEQLYMELVKQWGIYHEFLVAPMMRVYLAWQKPEKALEIATEALDRGAFSDIWVIAAQLQALSTKGRLDEAEEQLAVYIKTSHSLPSPDLSYRVVHALALGYAQKGDLDQVRRIYKRAREEMHLPVPKRDAWTAHMIAAAQRLSVEDICTVRKELESDGYLLGEQNYAIALLVFARQRELSLAQQWFDELLALKNEKDLEKQIPITPHIITAMVQAYARAGQDKEGYAFWQRMRTELSTSAESAAKIDNALLSVLLDLSGRGLTVKETNNIWHIATKIDGVKVNGNNGAALVEAYMRHGELDKAVKTVKLYQYNPQMHGMGVMLGGLRTRCREQQRDDLIKKLDG